MSHKINFRTEELADALNRLDQDQSEESFIGVILSLAEIYTNEIVLPVAVEGPMYRLIHDDEDGDFISVFTDMDEVEMGPETEIVLMTLKDICFDIMASEDLSGFMINAFTDPAFIDRDTVRAIMEIGLSAPLKDVTIDTDSMEPDELLDLAKNIEQGEEGFFPDPFVAASIYYSIAEDDDDSRPYDPDPEEEMEYLNIKSEAMNNLGALHLIGYGTSYDPEKAEELFKGAAELLNTTAMYNLGMLEESRDEFEEAVEYYRKASIMGDTKALVAYARMLMTGKGTEKDEETAFELLKKAMEDGEEGAYFYLGQYYEEGILGDKDEDKAGWYYTMGAI